jgi:hypothetical protein
MAVTTMARIPMGQRDRRKISAQSDMVAIREAVVLPPRKVKIAMRSTSTSPSISIVVDHNWKGRKVEKSSWRI